jgi:hypothetical protein
VRFLKSVRLLGLQGNTPPAPLRMRPTPVMPGPMSLLRTTFQSVPRLTGVTVLPTSSYPTMASMPRLTARGMSWAFPVSPASRYPSMASMRRTTARGMSWAFRCRRLPAALPWLRRGPGLGSWWCQCGFPELILSRCPELRRRGCPGGFGLFASRPWLQCQCGSSEPFFSSRLRLSTLRQKSYKA